MEALQKDWQLIFQCTSSSKAITHGEILVGRLFVFNWWEQILVIRSHESGVSL